MGTKLWTRVAIALLAAATLLAGCGGDDGDPATSEGAPTSSSTTQAPAGSDATDAPDTDGPTGLAPPVTVAAPDELPRLIDIAPEDRYTAVYGIYAADPEPAVLVELLGEALDSEVGDPIDGDNGAGFTKSQELLEAYATGMGTAGAQTEILARRETAPAAAEVWYLIALGYADLDSRGSSGDTDSTTDADIDIDAELLSRLDSHPDAGAAMHIMNLIGLRGADSAASGAIDTLTGYLDDPMEVTEADLPERDPVHPLAEAAAGALRRLGLTVTPTPGAFGFSVSDPTG